MRLWLNRFHWSLVIPISLLCLSGFLPAAIAATLNPYGIETDDPYVVDRFVEDGKVIDAVIFPGRPPESYRAPRAVIPESSAAAGTKTLTRVPAFNWSYGCSATSAAMMFGYYDNTGYPYNYTGPTNGGVMPMTNAVWGTTVWGDLTVGECPLSATHQGIDGRATKGHVDDYWILYGNAGPDPFIGNWAEHTQGECTADYMGTNKSQGESTDGSTWFYFYNDGSRLYDYTGAAPRVDGCHGLRLFLESRGYGVLSNFNQRIYGYNGNTQGFTFTDFKAEIDAGRPVLIQLAGHTMLGYGYNDTGSVVYIHDTWDFENHSMTWGGTYGGMAHTGVTVLVPTSGLYASFASDGLYKYNGSWTKLSSSLPANSVMGGTTLYAGFASDGFYKYDGSWVKLTSSQPATIAGSSTGFFAYFTGDGLYQYNGSWTLLTHAQPANMVVSGTTLYPYFASDGLYKYDGTWTKLTTAQPASIVGSTTGFFAYFTTDGLYQYNGSWNKLTSSQPAILVSSGTGFFAYFDGDGLYKYDGSWTKLTTAQPQSLMATGGGCYAYFASDGLYKYDGTWTKITSAQPASMATGGVAAFPYFTSDGLYEYNGTFTRLTTAQPASVIAPSLY